MYISNLSYFHSSRPHAARNDKDKVADILQVCKGDIQFCHRFPVKYLCGMSLPGARKRTSPATIKSPRRGFSQNP